MSRKKTHEEFVKKVYDLVGDEYEFLTKYKSSRIEMTIKHKKCEYIWITKPNGFLNGLKKNNGTPVCPHCNDTKKTTEQYKQEVYDLVGNDYIVLGKYINSYTPIKMKHNIENCICEFLAVPDTFLRKNLRCPNCHVNRKKKTHSKFVEDIEKIYGKNIYEFLTEYDYAIAPIKTKHIECGHVWYVRPQDLLSNKYGKVVCPNCNHGTKTLDTNLYKQKIFNLVGNEYIVLGEYINDKTHIRIKHNIPNCGHEFEVRPGVFIHGTRCPKCKESKGEKKISQFLDENNITYIPQYKFKNCKYKKRLKFDFAILKENKVMFLIEYDGVQHFEPKNFSGKGEDWAINELKNTNKRDQIKNQYCKDNNIKLYRIPYWKFDDIEGILNKLIHNEYIEIDENFIVQ